MEELQRSNTNIISSPEITSDLYLQFISYIDAKQKTIETYTRALKQLFNFLSLRGISRPKREDIILFRDELKASGHKPTTVQNYITATRLFFQWTEREGYYPNVADHIKGATISKGHKKDYLTSKQMRSILSSIETESEQGLRDYAIIVLMVTGGLRTIEVSRANIEDISSIGDCTVLYVQGKGQDEKSDYIKILPEVEASLRAYLKTRDITDGKEPLFCSLSNNSKGQRLTTRTISAIVKKKLVAAGYNSERLTAHSLRHTAVTLSLIGGNSLQEAQEFARHSNIATTQIYAHNLERIKNKCEETIAKAIF